VARSPWHSSNILRLVVTGILPGGFTWFSFLMPSVGFLGCYTPAAALDGVFRAQAPYRRGRIGDLVFAHALTNAL
jgi:hypothetical protein